MSEIEKVTLDGITYKVDDLTPRVKELFNFTIKLQDDLQEKAYALYQRKRLSYEYLKRIQNLMESLEDRKVHFQKLNDLQLMRVGFLE